MSTDGIRRRWASSGRTVALFRINVKESKISEVANGHTASDDDDDDDDILLGRRCCLYVSQFMLRLGFYGPQRFFFFVH
jgi:hypothetical protein